MFPYGTKNTTSPQPGVCVRVAHLFGTLAVIVSCSQCTMTQITPCSHAPQVLYHAYCAVVPITPLPFPPLPLVPDQPGPAYFGPTAEAAGPWLQLALYAASRCAGLAIHAAVQKTLRLRPLLLRQGRPTSCRTRIHRSPRVKMLSCSPYVMCMHVTMVLTLGTQTPPLTPRSSY